MGFIGIAFLNIALGEDSSSRRFFVRDAPVPSVVYSPTSSLPFTSRAFEKSRMVERWNSMPHSERRVSSSSSFPVSGSINTISPPKLPR